VALHNTSVYWSYYCSDDGCNSLSLWSLQYDTIQSLHRIVTPHHQHYPCQFNNLVVSERPPLGHLISSHLIFINTIPHYIIHTLLDSSHHTLSTTFKQLDHPFFPLIWYLSFDIDFPHYHYMWNHHHRIPPTLPYEELWTWTSIYSCRTSVCIVYDRSSNNNTPRRDLIHESS
jgi:hypothetical protein